MKPLYIAYDSIIRQSNSAEFIIFDYINREEARAAFYKKLKVTIFQQICAVVVELCLINDLTLISMIISVESVMFLLQKIKTMVRPFNLRAIRTILTERSLNSSD